jgi:hypothetical protein
VFKKTQVETNAGYIGKDEFFQKCSLKVQIPCLLMLDSENITNYKTHRLS